MSRLPVLMTLAALLALSALAASGCGGSSGNELELGTVKARPTEKQAPAPEPEVEPPVGFPLEEVGTMTGQIAEATYFKERFKLGPLLYSDEGTPPQAALEACRYVDSPAVIAASVYARGTIDFTYTEGTLPAVLSFGFAEQPVKGEHIEGGGLLSYDVNGSWICNSETESAGLEFEPSQTQHVPFWFIGYDVLSNGQPKLSPSIYNTWYFEFIGQTYGEDPQVRGPGAGRCYEELGGEVHSLFLFNRSGQC
jgi:hypothetical protein